MNDDERYPLIPPERRQLLQRLREHPAAPRWTMDCGDRLTARGLERVRAYERDLFASTRTNGPVPDWVRTLSAHCLADVPFYRNRGGRDFESLPCVTREDIRRAPWSFVPDSQPLDDMIDYFTAGTTGQRMDVLSHPDVASMRLPIYRKALASRGITLEGGEGRVAIAFVCSQSSTYTYASLSSFLGGAASVKINLNPADWLDPADRARFLDDCQPEIVTGDPLAFLDLAALPVSIKPKAMISSAMNLLPPVQEQLERRFGCPVIDIYSTTETGPIAYRNGDAFEILAHDVFVETIDGEIVVTVGRNPFLPLLRYRTGDYGRLSDRGIEQFEGRAPVVFRATDGRAINTIEVTLIMRHFPLAQYNVHQVADGSLTVRTSGATFSRDELASMLRALFGAGQVIAFDELPRAGRKVVPYTAG